MKALLIGAGAVGQTFGHHLARGGADVTFLVRPQYAEAARRGFDLHRLGALRRPRHERLDGAGVITSPEEAAECAWDQIWLCVSSTALRGPWLEELLLGLKGNGVLVLLQPGLDDHARVAALWPEGKIIAGVIMFIAYQTPLPGAAPVAPDGIAFWTPRVAPCPFAGQPGMVRGVVSTLRSGGLPSVEAQDAPAQAATLSAMMMPNLLALEHAGWSLSRFYKSDARRLAREASTEALRVLKETRGLSPPALPRFIVHSLLGPAMTMGEAILPLPLESFLKTHFTKVGDQTRAMVSTYIEHGARADLPVAALTRLRQMLQTP